MSHQTITLLFYINIKVIVTKVIHDQISKMGPSRTSFYKDIWVGVGFQMDATFQIILVVTFTNPIPPK